MYYYVLLCITMYYYVLLCITMYYFILLCITMYYYVLLFADDTTIYYSHTNLNKDLQILSDWFKTNKLNVGKTQYMIFNKKNQRAQDAELKIGQENVNQVKYTKCLGIYIDENLDWSKHIQQCKCKISSTLKNIVLQFSLPISELWDITMGEHIQKASP